MDFDEREEHDDTGFGETSRYAAHLDRGWSMLDRGEFDAARNSAHHARRIRGEAPDAAVLLGAVALAEGDPQEGLRWYDTALELDPEYCEPYVAAAQISFFDLGDPERALEYCDEALEMAVVSAMETLDLHLLAAECEVSLGRDSEAQARLEPLAEHRLIVSLLAYREQRGGADDDDDDDGDEAGASATLAPELERDEDGEPLDAEERELQIQRVLHFCLRMCRLWLDLAQVEDALKVLRVLVDRYPSSGDAWHLLSEAEFLGNDPRASCHAALRVYRLDAQLKPPDWVPNAAQLNRKIVQTLGSCADEALRELSRRRLALVLLIHDVPSIELILEGVDPRVPALALTTRAPVDGDEDSAPLLTGLAIYRRNIMRLARSPEQFDQELRFAVLDELACALQFPNERRIKLGLPPLPTLGESEEDSESEEGEARPARERRRRKRMHS